MKKTKVALLLDVLRYSGLHFTTEEIVAIRLAVTCVDRAELEKRGGTFALEGLDSLLEVSNA